MMFSFSKSSPANLSTYSGKKPGGADNELLPLALQHHRGSPEASVVRRSIV